VVEVLRNELPEFQDRPVPISLSFSTQQNGAIDGPLAQQQGTPRNAAPRAVVDWRCGAVQGRFRCDWQGQGCIMANHVVVSLETWRPTNVVGANYVYDPVLSGGLTPPIYSVGLGVGALQPALPLTYTTPYQFTDAAPAPIPTFARSAKLFGARSPGSLPSSQLQPSMIQLLLLGASGVEEIMRKTWDARAVSDGILFPPGAQRWQLLNVDPGGNYYVGLQFELAL
jgi:hypothetical protein